MKMPSLVLILCLVAGCSPRIPHAIPQDMKAYEEEMQQWRNDRLRLLTAPEGWLSVVGLYWLKPGENAAGTREDMDLVLPRQLPSVLGKFTLEGDKVYFESAGEAYVTVDGKRLVEGEVKTDRSDDMTKLHFKAFVFYIIERDGKFGLRLKNTLSDKRFTLKEIPAFPLDPAYRVYARAREDEAGKTLRVEDVTGAVQEYRVEAVLEFYIDGKKQELLAFDGGPDHYFVIFRDATTHESSYGGGRYMYVPRKPDAEGYLVLDFNKAFNPPCVFTDWATCPIPPEENRLETAILAGEKYPVEFSER